MGNVIIVKGADYSASDLGKVTILPDDKEIIQQAVATYYAAAGNVGNVGAINKIVTDLVVNGLWFKVKVLYPILGTTLASQVVDLKGVQDLQPYSNATAGENKIAFDNHVGIGDISELQSSVNIDYAKRMFIVGMNFASGGTNSYILAGAKEKNSDFLICSYNKSGAGRVLQERYIKISEAAIMPVLGDYLCGIYYNTLYKSQGVDAPRMETFQNGVKHEYDFDSRFVSIPTGSKPIYPYVGGAWNTGTTSGETITESSVRQTIAGCNFWFYVEAEVDSSAEAVLLDSICREFCASTGK